MADLNLTMSQMNSIFHRVTSLIFGYDIDNTDTAIATAQRALAGKAIRMTWQTAGSPPWHRDEDVAFIQVMPDEDAYNKQKDIIYTAKNSTTLNETFAMTNVIAVHWAIYGPNSYDRAMKIFTGLSRTKISSELSKYSIYQILTTSAPQRMPELYGAEWWERTNITVRFNTTISITQDRPILEAPKVTIINE